VQLSEEIVVSGHLSDVRPDGLLPGVRELLGYSD
jgi:hypothetical protein